MKKLVLSLLFVFAIVLCVKASCDGNKYNVTSWDNVTTEFTWHCCGGDKIEVKNVLTGEIRTYELPEGLHGGGSSCA